MTGVARRAGASLALIVVTVTGCGSGSSPTAAPASSHRTEPVGFNPPGPPGPTVPDDVQPAVIAWFALLQRKSCTTLIRKTTQTLAADPDTQTEGLRAAAHIYRAAGEVCANKLTSAENDANVDVEASGWTDCSGQPVLLQRWVQLMIRALRGDSAARSTVDSLPEPSPCATESPSEEPSPSESGSPSSG